MISFLVMISLLLIILLILGIKFQQRFFKSPQPTNSINFSEEETTNYLPEKMTTKAKIIEVIWEKFNGRNFKNILKII
jgi:hypothetical protein